MLSDDILCFPEAGEKMECGLASPFLKKTSATSAFEDCFHCACESSLGF